MFGRKLLAIACILSMFVVQLSLAGLPEGVVVKQDMTMDPQEQALINAFKNMRQRRDEDEVAPWPNF